MLGIDELERMKSLLKDIYAVSDKEVKAKVLDIAYVLDCERKSLEELKEHQTMKSCGLTLNAEHLFEDNKRLFDENRRLKAIIVNMKESLEPKLNKVHDSVNRVVELIEINQ